MLDAIRIQECTDAQTHHVSVSAVPVDESWESRAHERLNIIDGFGLMDRLYLRILRCCTTTTTTTAVLARALFLPSQYTYAGATEIRRLSLTADDAI